MNLIAFILVIKFRFFIPLLYTNRPKSQAFFHVSYLFK